MLQLQKQWKTAGTCPPGEEHKLWRRFSKAQDVFFKAKKAQFADRNKEEKEKTLLRRESFLRRWKRSRLARIELLT